jgi:hypothetical protein
VDQREDPRARAAAGRRVSVALAPHGDERLLHGILRERTIAHHAQRKAIGDGAEAVVELAERGVVAGGRAGEDILIGGVGGNAFHRRGTAARTYQSPLRREGGHGGTPPAGSFVGMTFLGG